MKLLLLLLLTMIVQAKASDLVFVDDSGPIDPKGPHGSHIEVFLDGVCCAVMGEMSGHTWEAWWIWPHDTDRKFLGRFLNFERALREVRAEVQAEEEMKRSGPDGVH